MGADRLAESLDIEILTHGQDLRLFLKSNVEPGAAGRATELANHSLNRSLHFGEVEPDLLRQVYGYSMSGIAVEVRSKKSGRRANFQFFTDDQIALCLESTVRAREARTAAHSLDKGGNPLLEGL
jgi:hypothetical protein